MYYFTSIYRTFKLALFTIISHRTMNLLFHLFHYYWIKLCAQMWNDWANRFKHSNGFELLFQVAFPNIGVILTLPPAICISQYALVWTLQSCHFLKFLFSSFLGFFAEYLSRIGCYLFLRFPLSFIDTVCFPWIINIDLKQIVIVTTKCAQLKKKKNKLEGAWLRARPSWTSLNQRFAKPSSSFGDPISFDWAGREMWFPIRDAKPVESCTVWLFK